MTNKEILEKIKNIFINNEPKVEEPKVEEVINVLSPEEKMTKMEYIQNNIEVAKDETIASIYDILFAEVGEIKPEEAPAPEEAEAEAVKEEIIENAHVEAEAIVAQEENEIVEIKNQITNFLTSIETLKNENIELKNKIEELGNQPSGNVVKVISNKVDLTPLEKEIEELKKKRNKK